MRRFTQLYDELDATNRTNEKVAALVRYFQEAPPRDAAWGLFFLIGAKVKRAISGPVLREVISEVTQMPHWMIGECYDAVGDVAETAALLMPDVPGAGSDTAPLHQLVEERLLPLPALPDSERRALLVETWATMDQRQRYVWNKLITGEFRVGVAKTLVIRGLAIAAGIEPPTMAHRMMGTWRPTEEDYLRLHAPDGGEVDPRRPYPFCLAYPLEVPEAVLPRISEAKAVAALTAPHGEIPTALLESHDGEPNPKSSRKSSRPKSLETVLNKTLGPVGEWQAEWKWDGIRAQLLKRGGEVLIWSRGEDLITDRFPEVAEVGKLLPDGTVLDGEILAWKDGKPLRFSELQKRITLKSVSRKALADVPAAFMAYDLLEHETRDVRQEPLATRRALLEQLIETTRQRDPIFPATPADSPAGIELQNSQPINQTSPHPDLPLFVSPVQHADSWQQLAELRALSRINDAEGLMLKRLSSPYQVGRVRGDWWKWKIEPYTIDAVLIYAQRGHGRRASLYTDYTFGLWKGGELVPVAKAYSGLTDAEIKEVDAWVRRHTLERFGPIRSVKAELVFELAFEGIQPSTRHKSGVAVRFPRIATWRRDKKPDEADTLDALKVMAGLNIGLQADEGRVEKIGQLEVELDMSDSA